MAHHNHRGRRVHAKRPRISDMRQEEKERENLRHEEKNNGRFDDSHYEVVQARQAPEGSATTVVMTVVQIVREGSTIAQFTVPTLPATVSDPQLGEVTIPAGSEDPVVVPTPPPTQTAPNSGINSDPRSGPSVPPQPTSSGLSDTATTDISPSSPSASSSSSSLSSSSLSSSLSSFSSSLPSSLSSPSITESTLSPSDASSFSLSSELPVSSNDVTSAPPESTPSPSSGLPSESTSIDSELPVSTAESVAFTSIPTSLLPQSLSLELSESLNPTETAGLTSADAPHLYPSLSESEISTSPTEIPASPLPSSSSSPSSLPSESATAIQSSSPPVSSSAISETSLVSFSSSTLTGSSSIASTISSTISSSSTTASDTTSFTSTLSSTSSSLTSTQASSGAGGGGYGGTPDGGVPVPTVSNEGGQDSDGSSVPVPAVVGGVVGGVAGLIFLIILALLFFRYRKRKLAQTPGIERHGSATRGVSAAAGASAGVGAGATPASPTSPTSEVSERSSDPLFSGALLGATRAFGRWRDSGRPLGAEDIATTQRGFQKLGGRKITSVLESGGDGYDDKFGYSAGDVASPDSGGMSKEIGAGIVGASISRQGALDKEAAVGSSRNVPSPPLGRPPSETSNYSEKVTFRPSPARTAVATPVEVHPGTEVSAAARTGVVSLGGSPPPPLPLARITTSDAIGRSHSSADGSRASRFTEGV